MHTRDDCQRLDESDPLARFRDEFLLPPDTIYLDGNSLGAQPRAALERAQAVVAEEWGQGLIRSWNTAGWFDLPLRLGGKLAPLIGAGDGEVVVSDSTSINLFKALAAALHIQAGRQQTRHRKVILTERTNFPTDVYIAQGLSSWLDRGYEVRLVDSPEALWAAIDDDVAVVMLTHVNYRSGRMLDMVALTARAHDRQAIAIWDLAHSAGAVPVNLAAANADFAVGCTYKYLNGGPGAPAFIWVSPRHLAAFKHPLSGWWGHAQPFAMLPAFERHPGIRSALCGTQPIVALSLVECGLDIFAQTDMAALRRKSLALTDLFISLVETRCANHCLDLITPRPHEERGSQVSFRHPHGYAIVRALIDRGVIGDYRDPGIMRFGFAPLYIRYVDVWDAVDTLKRILDQSAYDTALEPEAVT